MALSAPRKNSLSRERVGIEAKPLAAGIVAWQGGIAVRKIDGYYTKGSAALNMVGIGRFYETKTGGAADGDVSVRVEEGVFNWKNSASGDLITMADRGKVAWIVDDETVAKTSGLGTRSPAGIILGVDANDGVWVLMGESVVANYISGRKKFVPLRLTTIAGAGSPAYRIVSPFSGLVSRLRSIAELALTTGDAVLTASIAGVAITNGVITHVQAASAAGDKYTVVPTALNYAAAGDELKVVVTGTQAAAASANFIFEIDAD